MISLCIVRSEDVSDTIAVHVGGEWVDPHGGVFTASDRASLDACAVGKADEVVIGEGTRYESRYAARLVALIARVQP